ncbi:MAG: hypothetical protein ACOC8F_05770 [Planctomycetota bacterium]
MKRKSHRRRRLLLAAGAVVLVVALGLPAGKFWIIPAVIRAQVAGNLADVWHGRVEVGDVTFRYFGPVHLSGLRLLDEQDRAWVSLGALELRLSDWPSLGPKLSVVRLASLDVRAHVADGRCDWPFRKPPPREGPPVEWRKYVDLREATIDTVTFGAVERGGRTTVWQGYRLDATGGDGSYRFNLHRPGADEPAAFSVSGRIDESGTLDADVVIHRRLGEAEAAALLGAAGAGETVIASGRVDADVRVRGPIGRPEQLGAFGEVVLGEWDVRRRGAPRGSGLSAEVALTGRTVELEELRGDVAGGRLWADGEVDLPSVGAVELRDVDVVLTGASVAELARSVSDQAVLASGTLDAEVRLQGGRIVSSDEGVRVADLYGAGRVTVEDGNLYAPTVVGEVIRALALPLAPSARADARAEFAVEGTKVSFAKPNHRAVLRSDLHATVVDAGTVDLATKAVDLYVVPVSSAALLDPLLPVMPGSELLGRVTDRLTRFRVSGRWDRPKDLDVRPAALRDVRKGILGGVGELLRPFDR